MTPLHSTCDQECSCCTTLQLDKCSTHCSTPQVLDLIYSSESQVKSAWCVERLLENCTLYAQSTSTSQISSQSSNSVLCGNRC